VTAAFEPNLETWSTNLKPQPDSTLQNYKTVFLC